MTIDLQTVAPIVGGSKQLMVYGFRDCAYVEVQNALKRECTKKGSPIQRVFDVSLACSPSETTEEQTHTLEGTAMNVLSFDTIGEHDQTIIARACKTALTDLVLENYKRKREGQDLIRCAFCLHLTGEGRPFQAQDMVSRDKDSNDKITHKELRRIYKLCFDPKVDERVREVAKETFAFVNVHEEWDPYRGENNYSLAEIDSPWKDKSFSSLWETRESSRTRPKKSGDRTWWAQLQKHVDAYDAPSKAPELSDPEPELPEPPKPEPRKEKTNWRALFDILSFFFLPLGILRLGGCRP